MRFSIFELLGWTAFLAVLCALLSRADWPAASILLGWFGATILALKFAGRRTAFFISLAAGSAKAIYDVFVTIPALRQAVRHGYSDMIVGAEFLGLAVVSSFSWIFSSRTWRAASIDEIERHGTEL